MSYLKELAKVSGNEFANLVDDGIFGGDVEQFIDTGSYVFNALLSGSIYGGSVSYTHLTLPPKRIV